MPKISDLPSVTTLTGTEQLPVVASGTTSRVSASIIAALGAPSAQAKNLINAGPATGVNAVPTFRSLVVADIGFAGVANGVASLDATGKVPSAQLPASTAGAMTYQGTWNASTNTPALASGAGTKGYLYKVATAGTTTLDGISTWNIGDSVVFDGTTWDKIDGIANEIVSVAGLQGVITAPGLKTALSYTYADLGSTGTAGQVLTSTGNSTSPTFQTPSAGGGSSNITAFNPADYGTNTNSLAFSNNNTTVVNNANNGNATRTLKSLPLGKVYFEILIVNAGVNDTGIDIGLCDNKTVLGIDPVSNPSPTGIGVFYRGNGQVFSLSNGSATFVGNLTNFTTGSKIGFAIDFNTGKAWILNNNVSLQGNPSTATSPIWTFPIGTFVYPVFYAGNSTEKITIIGGSANQTYVPPTGFFAVDG